MVNRALRSVVAIAVLAVATTLGACTPEPVEDPADAQVWLSEQFDAEYADEIGSAGGAMSVRSDDGTDETPSGTTLTFASDAPQTVIGLLAGCHGGGTATVSWSLTAATESTSASADIACDGDLHDVDPQSTAFVVEATLDVVSHDDTAGTWFAVLIGG